MLRSVRHTADELVLVGTVTPKKIKPADVDSLCDLFQAKASVTPMKNANSTTSAQKKAGKPENTKENLGKAFKMAPGSAVKKSTRFTTTTKKAAVTPVRRRA